VKQGFRSWTVTVMCRAHDLWPGNRATVQRARPAVLPISRMARARACGVLRARCSLLTLIARGGSACQSANGKRHATATRSLDARLALKKSAAGEEPEGGCCTPWTWKVSTSRWCFAHAPPMVVAVDGLTQNLAPQSAVLYKLARRLLQHQPRAPETRRSLTGA